MIVDVQVMKRDEFIEAHRAECRRFFEIGVRDVRTVADCKRCEKRGWIKGASNAFPDVCSRCGGRGRLTVRALAKLCNVTRSTIYRFLRNEALGIGRETKTRTRIEKEIAQESVPS